MIEFLLLVSVGLLAGGINAVAGGGAILIFPVLLALGVPPVNATATISLAVLPGIVASVYGYRTEIRSSPKIFWWLLIPVMAGAFFGAQGLININPNSYEKVVPWLVLSAVILLMLQTKIHRLIVTEKHLVKTSREFGIPVLFLIVFVLALYGGFFSVGVGLMFIAVLGLTSRLKNVHQVNSIKNLLGAGLTLVLVWKFAGANLVNISSGLTVAFGTLVGGYFGASYSKHIRSHTVHNIAVVLGVLIVIYLFLK